LKKNLQKIAKKKGTSTNKLIVSVLDEYAKRELEMDQSELIFDIKGRESFSTKKFIVTLLLACFAISIVLDIYFSLNSKNPNFVLLFGFVVCSVLMCFFIFDIWDRVMYHYISKPILVKNDKYQPNLKFKSIRVLFKKYRPIISEWNSLGQFLGIEEIDIDGKKLRVLKTAWGIQRCGFVWLKWSKAIVTTILYIKIGEEKLVDLNNGFLYNGDIDFKRFRKRNVEYQGIPREFVYTV
jgi:hypothetical protein